MKHKFNKTELIVLGQEITRGLKKEIDGHKFGYNIKRNVYQLQAVTKDNKTITITFQPRGYEYNVDKCNKQIGRMIKKINKELKQKE